MLRLNELFILAASLCAPNCYREAFQSPDGRSSLSLAIVWRREVPVLSHLSVFNLPNLPLGLEPLESMRMKQGTKWAKSENYLLSLYYV